MNMMRTTTSTTKTFKVAKNRGVSRIWIEGAFLTQKGILSGMRFNKEFTKWEGLYESTPAEADLLRLEIIEGGHHKISGNAARPIIDLNGKYLDEFFSDGCTHYRAEITKITGFEENTLVIYIERVD